MIKFLQCQRILRQKENVKLTQINKIIEVLRSTNIIYTTINNDSKIWIKIS